MWGVYFLCSMGNPSSVVFVTSFLIFYFLSSSNNKIKRVQWIVAVIICKGVIRIVGWLCGLRFIWNLLCCLYICMFNLGSLFNLLYQFLLRILFLSKHCLRRWPKPKRQVQFLLNIFSSIFYMEISADGK